MYKDIYYKADQLAEAIRSGTYNRSSDFDPTMNKARSLVSRRSSEVQQDSSGGVPVDDPMFDYFLKVKEENEKLAEEIRQLREGQSGAYSGKSMRGGKGEMSDLQRAKASLAKIESGGSKDPYRALGPIVGKGSYAGDRAYGKYQVMGKNIPEWTKQALGKAMTPSEFLSNPDAQEAVADYRLTMYYNKYGSWEDAASVWFSGRPVGVGDMGQTDGYTSRAAYVSKFNSNF